MLLSVPFALAGAGFPTFTVFVSVVDFFSVSCFFEDRAFFDLSVESDLSPAVYPLVAGAAFLLIGDSPDKPEAVAFFSDEDLIGFVGVSDFPVASDFASLAGVSEFSIGVDFVGFPGVASDVDAIATP